jgi:hypothetical protein
MRATILFIVVLCCGLQGMAQNSLLSSSNGKTWKTDLLVINDRDTIQDVFNNCIYESKVTFYSDFKYSAENPCEIYGLLSFETYSLENNILTTASRTFYIEELTQNFLKLKTYVPATESGDDLEEPIEHIIPLYIHYRAQ